MYIVDDRLQNRSKLTHSVKTQTQPQTKIFAAYDEDEDVYRFISRCMSSTDSIRR
jgi:hypothetical protein